ncbi:MAG TPA: ABC transporter ATP-binding protein [Roseiflexaceae bacterium]|nr:ABC transporter ATP-binding protein [Roseiflexaceae bacterium]
MSLSTTKHWSLLTTYLGPQWRRAALLALLLFGSIALQLLNPQIIRYFIDTAQAGVADQRLLLAAAVFIVAGLAQRAIAFGTLLVSENVGWTATNALRADLARHCLRLDMSFHKTHTPGELIERIDGDVSALDDFLSQFSIRLLGNSILIVAILALLFREDWRLGVGLTVYTLLAFAALSSVQRLGTQRWTAYRQADAQLFGFLEERMSGTEDIRASGAEAHTLRRLDLLLRATLERNRAARLVSNLTFVTTNFLFVIGYGLGLAIGAYLYGQGSVSIGTAFLIVYYIGMLSWPLESIREQAQNLQQASASISRIGDLLALRPRVIEAPRATLPAGALALAFERVSFEYDDEGPKTKDQRPNAPDTDYSSLVLGPWSSVLSDVSFTLAPGTKLGLLGRTGSGKTTLSRLIFRLYDPTAGAINLGGADLRDAALADLRGRVGMVTQDVQLFQASIRDNLALFDRTIEDARIEWALGELGLLEWLRALPEGLDTRLGAGGLGLSAGEAQLLAFARVFLRDPGLVILDEASSRLDPATERLLERAIDRLLAGRSAIIIAHRLGTVQRADTVMILDRGQVAEYGPREQLARDDSSRFAKLLQTGLEEVLA